MCAESFSVGTFPQNAAVLVGQSVIFHCRTELNGSIWWKFKSAPIESAQIIIFKEGNVTEDKYVVNTTATGQFDLHISKTRLSDAGTYTCTVVVENAIVSHHSELVVFDSVPVCDTNLTGSHATSLEENNSLLAWCSVEFRGNLSPVMEWIIGSNGEIRHSGATIISRRTIYCEIIVQDKNREEDFVLSFFIHFDGSSFNYLIKNAGERLSTTSNNIPDYNFTWTIGLIHLRRASAIVASTINLPTTVRITEIERTSLINAASVSDSSVVLMIVSFLAIIVLLCIVIFRCIVVKKSVKEQTVRDNFGPISSQDANNVRTTNSRITFRQNTSDRVYEDITSEDHVYSAEPVHRVTSNEAAVAPENVTISTAAGPQFSSYVGVWMEGPDGARGSSSDGVIFDVPTYDYVQRDTRSQDTTPCWHENADWPTENVGADETVYTEVNTANGSHMLPLRQQRPPIQSLFSKSIYASIDHTAQNITTHCIRLV